MSFFEIFDRERENLTILILTLLAYLLIYKFESQAIIETTIILGIYIVVIILNFFFLKLILLRRIKIKESKENYQEDFKVLKKGKKFFGFLDIEIPEHWKISDCYITLESIKPIYYADRILITEDGQKMLSDFMKPEQRLLHWRSSLSYQNKTKLIIGENSNRESFSIGKIVTGEFGDAEINTFNFDVQRNNPNMIDFKQFGLYEFSIKFHWKKHNREMIPKKIDGYIYSQYKNGIKIIRVGVGNYKSNENIPKPIEKEIKEKGMRTES